MNRPIDGGGKRTLNGPVAGESAVRREDRYGLKAFDAATRVCQASSLADETFHNG